MREQKFLGWTSFISGKLASFVESLTVAIAIYTWSIALETLRDSILALNYKF